MEHVVLKFDMNEKGVLNPFEATGLREEISLKLDSLLRQADMGKWISGRGSQGTIKILLQVKGYEPALHLIESALAGHWLLNRMKISRY